MGRIITRLLIACSLLCMFAGGVVADALAHIQSSEISYFEDTAHSDDLETASARFRGDSGITVAEEPFNLGTADAYYWLSLRAHNSSRHAQQVQLLAAVAYRPLLKVYRLAPGRPASVILEDSHEVHFNQRNGDSRWLVSIPFELEPGEAATLVLQYHAVGSTYLPIFVDTVENIQSRLNSDSVNAALFYSFSTAAIIMFLLFGIAMADRIAVSYAALFVTGLLMLASMEGLAFKYLWPDSPAWNHLSPLVMIYLFCALGFYVAQSAALKADKNEITLKIISMLSIASLVMLVMVFILPFELMAKLFNVFISVMFVSQAYAISTWVAVGQKRNSIAIIAAVLIALCVVLLVLLSLDASVIPGHYYVYSTRLIYIAASLATMATIISHVSGLKRDYEHSLENEVIAAKRDAETSRQLYEAEQNYARVKALAGYRQRQLAEASHDMRQPLTSLRSTMDAIAHNQAPALKIQLHNAFDYLENLCSTYLGEARDENDTVTMAAVSTEVDPAAGLESDQVAPYPVNMLFETASRMFVDEAKSQGIALRYAPSTIELCQPPMVLMRIITNMVSNAIKHMGHGRLLLGLRRGSDSVAILVIDNGVGIRPEMLDSIMKAYAKGPESSGEGLGLAICQQLAKAHGMRLDIASVQGRGTCCRLTIPRFLK